jgi:competence protein ComGC
MKRIRNQQGFAVLELLLIIIILGIIAFVAWRVIDANGTVTTTTPAQSTVSNPVPAASSAADLDNLGQQLDNTNLNDTTNSDLTTQATF